MQKKRLNKKSIEVQNSLAIKLNNICKCLDDLYNINDGGCCFIAYCLAKMLESDKFDFKIVVYGYKEKVKHFNNLELSHTHYAIHLGNIIINQSTFKKYPKKEYIAFSEDIFKHYSEGSWNSYYNKNKNKFIQRQLKTYYNDFIRDLREEWKHGLLN